MKAVDVLARIEHILLQHKEGAIFAAEGVFAITNLIDVNMAEVIDEHNENIRQGLESGEMYSELRRN